MISIIIPTYNEPNIDKIVTEIHNTILNCEIVISTDEFGQGKGYALKKGTTQAQGELIVWLDADLQIHPQEIRTFLKYMYNSDATAVVGNKRHAHSITHYSLLRRITSRVYNWIVCQLFGFSLRDTQCGLKIFKAEALKRILDKIHSQGFGFDLEVLVALRENNYRIVDAPVLVTQNKDKGSINLRNIKNTFIETIKIWIRKKKGLYVC